MKDISNLTRPHRLTAYVPPHGTAQKKFNTNPETYLSSFGYDVTAGLDERDRDSPHKAIASSTARSSHPRLTDRCGEWEQTDQPRHHTPDSDRHHVCRRIYGAVASVLPRDTNALSCCPKRCDTPRPARCRQSLLPRRCHAIAHTETARRWWMSDA